MPTRWALLWATTAALGAFVAFVGAPGAAADQGGLTIAGPSGSASIDAGVGLDLTNRGATACQVTTRPMGALAVLSVSRDSQALVPVPATVRTLDGLSGEHRGRFRSLPPGATARITLRAVTMGAEGSFLPSVSWGADGVPFALLWPVDAPGHYVATVSYEAPSSVVAPADACPSSSAPTAVTFEVGANGRSFPWFAVGGLVGALVIVAVILVILLRRRRGPGAPGKPGSVTVAILLCVALSGLLIGWAQRAHASVQAPDPSAGPGARDVANFWKVCLGRFLASGGDPAGVVGRVLASKRTVLLAPTDGESTTISRQGVSTIVILWNPLDDAELSSGKKQDPCATLYHELAHADAAEQGQDSDDPCGDTGISKAEAKATLKENQYRAGAGLPQREKYDEHPLPKSESECDKPPAKPKPPPKVPPKRGHGVDGGRSTGDPHVFTFDRARYDLMGVGEYVLTTTGQPGFSVQIRSQPFSGSRTVSVNTAVAMDVDGDRVMVSLEGPTIRLRANGKDATATFEAPLALAHGGTVEAIDLYGYAGYVIEWVDGSAVQVLPVGPWALDVTVEPADGLHGKLRGLLGDADGNATNDFVGRDGNAYPAPLAFDDLYRHYGEGWRVQAGESLFEYAPGESTETFTERSFPDQTKVTSAPPGLAAAEAACRRIGLADPARIAECAYDLAVTGRPEFASAALGEESSAATSNQTGTPAQTAIPSTPGQSTDIGFDREVSGTILGSGQIDTFRLTVPADGAVVFVRGLQSCDATRVLTMQLYRPSGGLIDVAQACRGFGREELKEAGAWTISVYGDRGATGPYRFIVAKFGSDVSGTAGVDRTLSGAIKLSGQVDRYTFAATAGQIIYVRGPGCQPNSPAIGVLLKNPDGIAINLSGACDGFGRQVLNVAGSWTFEVSGRNDATGDYSVDVIAVRADRIVASGLGQRLSGTIESIGVNDVFTFDVANGQVVYVRALEACSDVNRNVRLLLVNPSGTGTDLAAACDGLHREELRDAGTWRIVVSAGAITGTYRMELLGVRPDAVRPIAVGQTVEGVIEQVGARDRWTFNAQTGDRVAIRGLVDCTSADLRWELVNQGGGVTDTGRLCDKSPAALQFPISGEWTIRVAAASDGTGSYRFALERN